MLQQALCDRAQRLFNPGPARSAGLLVNAPRPDVLRFSPALNVTADEIDLAAGMWEVALANALPAAARGI